MRWFSILQWLFTQVNTQVLIRLALIVICSDKEALLLPEASHAFLIVTTLLRCELFFPYWFHNSQKSYQGKNMSCLSTAESHLKCNTSTKSKLL